MNYRLLVGILFIAVSCQSSADKSTEFFNAGLVYFEYNEYDAALLSFEESIKADPQNFEAYYYRGNCFLNMSDYDAAIVEFVKATEINSDYADAYANIGQAYFYLKDYQLACKYFQKAQDLGKYNLEDKLRHCN